MHVISACHRMQVEYVAFHLRLYATKGFVLIALFLGFLHGRIVMFAALENSVWISEVILNVRCGGKVRF